MQVAPHARSEQRGELIGRVREARHRTRLLYYPRAFIAQEALDYGPAERADAVNAGPAIPRVPKHTCLRDEWAGADDLQK
jgi:hypothetical protein